MRLIIFCVFVIVNKSHEKTTMIYHANVFITTNMVTVVAGTVTLQYTLSRATNVY